MGILAALAVLLVVLAVYLLWARPYRLRWGATDAELAMAMPGDELAPNASFLATRAITVDATPQAIWPWLIQAGYGRAGFYGYDLIENAGSPSGLRSADHILPEFQNFKPGDEIRISAVASMVFGAIAPNHYLIWTSAVGPYPGAFTWALYPVDATHTRLVSRIRWRYHWTQPGLLALDLFTEFTDHLAVPKVLQGIKGRVEGHIQPFDRQTVELGVYIVAILVFLAAIVLLLWNPLTWPRWFAVFAAGLGWQIAWYAPVSIWIGAFLMALVIAGLILTFR